MQIIEEKYNWSGVFSNRSKTDYIVLHHGSHGVSLRSQEGKMPRRLRP